VIELHQVAAAVYLAAGIGALLAIVLSAPRMGRGAVWGLGLGATFQLLAIALGHGEMPLDNLAGALAIMSWMSVVFLLILMWRLRLPGLAAVVGPVAFLTVFIASLHAPEGAVVAERAGGPWPHAHVLLASAGLALLGLAGVAGLFYILEFRRIKAKRPLVAGIRLPSLEALDRVNMVALSIGFPLLSLGLVTGIFWLQEVQGRLWSGSHHETWTAIAWAVYAALVTARFAGHQGARQAAASAVGGFAFLIFAVVGVGVLT